MGLFIGILAGLAVIVVVLMIFSKKKETPVVAAEDDLSKGVTNVNDISNDYPVVQYSKGIQKKNRNFIILLCLLIGIIGLIVYIKMDLNKKYKIYEGEEADLIKKVQEKEVELARESDLREQLRSVQEQVFLNNKQMMNTDSPSITLKYLFDIADKYNNHMAFDFNLLHTGNVPEDPDVTYNSYKFSGEVFINQIYSFIDQFERQPAFYSIENIEFNSRSADQKGLVGFEITARSYYAGNGINPEDIEIKSLKKRSLKFNPFYPRIHPILENTNEDFLKLIDVFAIQLVGLSKDRAFVFNEHNGQVEEIRVGDKVRYGSLVNIDWDKEEINFNINRYGLMEKIQVDMENDELN